MRNNFSSWDNPHHYMKADGQGLAAQHHLEAALQTCSPSAVVPASSGSDAIYECVGVAGELWRGSLVDGCLLNWGTMDSSKPWNWDMSCKRRPKMTFVCRGHACRSMTYVRIYHLPTLDACLWQMF